ncbi:hypothetical protein H0H92_012608 [Tricholoma furcatifolium]|nr:hypothetical protein H0H92_012608 [Tricholoma furcatifolium]
MQTWKRYGILLISLLITLHLYLQFTHEGYKQSTSISAIGAQIKTKWNGKGAQTSEESGAQPDLYTTTFEVGPDDRLNATFVILARNTDFRTLTQSIRSIEERFNHKYGYPYVLLNEVPFSDDFKEGVQALTNATMEFGVIPPEHWYQPDWIDEEKATANRKQMVKDKVLYGGSVAFNSGFFFKHELLQKYRWYWRIEPNIKYLCDIQFDPFRVMQNNDKVYGNMQGFVISLYEYASTIPSLWGHVKDFMEQNPQYIAEDNALNFLSTDNGETYDLCHFWSNFEIADMDFYRGEAYQAYFEYLDSKGGFYYERWGDAPVHSIAASLFLPKEKIHFFDMIAYEHQPFQRCPGGTSLRKEE